MRETWGGAQDSRLGNKEWVFELQFWDRGTPPDCGPKHEWTKLWLGSSWILFDRKLGWK
jgi:hypothetical protein